MIEPALNLLPPADQASRRLLQRYHVWLQIARWPAILVICLLVIAQATSFRLARHQTTIQAEEIRVKAEASASPSGDVTKMTAEVNEAVTRLLAARSTFVFPSRVATLLNTIPTDIRIQKIDIKDSGQVTIEGVAATRASFLAIDQALKQASFLTRVATTSTASKREDLPFTYTATFK